MIKHRHVLLDAFPKITSKMFTGNWPLWLPAVLAAWFCLSAFYRGEPAPMEFSRTGAPLIDTTVQQTICAGDSIQFGGQVLNSSGTYTETFTASDGSDSTVTLVLTVLPPIQTNLAAAICEGSFYLFQGDTLTSSGFYADTLTAANGCDSVVTLKLEVAPFFATNLDVSICAGETYIFGNDTLSSSGLYVDPLVAQGGCDSVVTLRLTVLPVRFTDLTAAICEGSFYVFQGDTLTSSGLYIDTLTAVNGCDSIVSLKLEVAPFFETPLSATICANETYEFAGETLSQSGVYVDTLTALGGCDSLIVLTLEVLPLSESETTAVICANESYEFNGQIYTEAGTYTATLTGANGCDSVATLVLEVLPLTAGETTAAICAGESYDFNGETLTEAGTYTATLTGANGCDSVATLVLEVLPFSFGETLVSICPGESYDFNGTLLTEAGTYIDTLTGANGCDSISTLILEILPLSFEDVFATICAGEAYDFNGEILTETGVYFDTLTGSNGCDSIVTLTLEVLPVSASEVGVVICANESYEFNGEILTNAGTYTATLAGDNGCDSTVTLVLEVLSLSAGETTATICANESYDFNGEILTGAGTYMATLTGANGCDSVATLVLEVLPLSYGEQSASICAGELYFFYGQALTESGTYTATLPAANGCDSIITLTLEVLPVQTTPLSISICAGAEYEFNGDTLTESGLYTYPFTGQNGCDSIVALTLTVGPAIVTNLSVTRCETLPYEFNGTTLDTPGTYTAVLPAANGCDSTVILDLNFVSAFQTEIAATICTGETYAFGGDLLAESGVYTDTLTAAGGCDSVLVLTLNVLPTLASEQSASICGGETYAFNGVLLAETGTYTATLTGANGCDSIVTLTLTVLPVAETNVSATICAGEGYPFAGQLLLESGVYTGAFTGANGCDSTVTLTLEVLPVYQTAIAGALCPGTVLEYNGQALTVPGEYSFTFAAENGCDSMVVVTLTELTAPQTGLDATICEGESYEFNGLSLTDAGVYTAVLPASNGCDSTTVLTLTVLPTAQSTQEATICAGENFTFNGQTLTIPGVYTYLLTAANGCDSVATLVLTVNAADAGVELQGGTLVAQATGASYVWIDCSTNQPVPNATGSTFTPNVTGNYAVQVTQNGCTALSACVFVEVVSTRDLDQVVQWQIWPNPAAERAYLQIEHAATGPLEVEVFDQMGRLVYRRQAVETGVPQVLDLQGMPQGVLLIKLTDGRASAAKRLVKITE